MVLLLSRLVEVTLSRGFDVGNLRWPSELSMRRGN
jgi:hypothetical protein